jgi:hypothetical protein
MLYAAAIRSASAHACRYAASTDSIVSSSSSRKLASTSFGIPASALVRPASATSNHTRSANAACFTRPSSVVNDGTKRRLACSS